MRALIQAWIVCVGVACAGVAMAAPKVAAHATPKVAARASPNVVAEEKYQRAVQLDDHGEAEQALAVIEEGLAVAPKHLRLLYLKGAVLLKQRDLIGALTAYQAYLNAGAVGANRRAVEKIVQNLRAVQSTFLDVTLANGPATVFLGSKAEGVFCTAAPSCKKAAFPGQYRVISERPGFERWTGNVTIANGKTATLAVTLVENPSLVTVRVAQPGARVTVDDAAYDAPTTVPAGSHRVVVSLAGHVEARLEAVAHEGKPVALDVALTPLVAIHVEPPGAQLLLDGQPVVIADGSIAIPPGAHALVARATGFGDRRIEIPAERAPDYQLVVELARIPEVVVRLAPGPFTPRRKIALAVGGLGLLAASAGVVLGVQSGHLDDDTYALCPSSSDTCRVALEANDLNLRARSRALEANVAFGVAGGAAIAAAVLWLTGAPESRVAVTPQLGAVAGLDLAVRF